MTPSATTTIVAPDAPDADTVQALRATAAHRLACTRDTDAHRAATVAEVIADWAKTRAHAGHPAVSADFEHELFHAVLAALSGLGGLQPLLEREDVENIHLHGHDQVFLELADGTLHRCATPVTGSDEELLQLLQDLFARQGQTSREFSPAHPLANLRLPAGGPLGCRVAALREITDRPRVAIRRHRLHHARLADLTTGGSLDPGLAQFLASAVAAGINLLVTGGPFAGKTTLLRALCHEIPSREHVITVEDDYELGLHLDAEHHPLVTPMQARTSNADGAGQITLDDLLTQALRHSPSRVLVGEVRAGEITALLRALGNGAAGGMGTLHARSVHAVPDRIAALAQLATPPLPIHACHHWTASALDLIVHVSRRDHATGRDRFVSAIAEVGPVGDAPTPDLTVLFGPRPGDGRAVPVCPPGPELAERLRACGFDPAIFHHPAGQWDSDGGP